MPVIPQRTLRNDIGDVLRRVEQGEHFTITVAGRPVAELGPVGAPGPQRFVPGDDVRRMLEALPPDPMFMEDIRDAGGGLPDPFE